MTAPANAATVPVQRINQRNTGWVALDEVLLTRVGQGVVIKRSSYGRGRAAHRHPRQQPSHQRQQSLP